jgi:phosphoserine aminotransferase
MNVTFRTPTPELDALFVFEADAAGLKGLKGHRSVGGLRASIYNACSPESVDALVSFMRDFEAVRG